MRELKLIKAQIFKSYGIEMHNGTRLLTEFPWVLVDWLGWDAFKTWEEARDALKARCSWRPYLSTVSRLVGHEDVECWNRASGQKWTGKMNDLPPEYNVTDLYWRKLT